MMHGFVFRLAASKYTDERVKVMNEIISGIRVIKMYGWEYAFKRLIARIRKCVLTFKYIYYDKYVKLMCNYICNSSGRKVI